MLFSPTVFGRLAALVLLSSAWADHAPAAMVFGGCGDLRYKWIEDPAAAVAAQPRFPDHPLFMKVRFALGDSSYNFMQELHTPTILMKAENGQTILPVSKREPFTQGVSVFGHFSVRGGEVSYRKPTLQDGDYLMYDMDISRTQVYRKLGEEYARQKLPPQAWDFIEMQEFSLAESRKAEVSINLNGELVGYIRAYNASTNDKVMAGNFETQVPKRLRTSALSGLNINQGAWDFHVSPAERLAHALHMENPYASLRRDFPNMAFVELGRMYIKRDLDAAQGEQVKQLLWTGAMDVVTQMSGGDISNAMMLASGGPFGARYYPKTYNWHPIAEKQITSWQDLAMRSAPGAEAPVMTVFSKDPHAAMNRTNEVNPADVKPVTFFATSGTELVRALESQNLLLKNYPTTHRMVSSIESERLPWVKPLPNERYDVLP